MSTKPATSRKPRPRVIRATVAPTLHETSTIAAEALVCALGPTVAAHLGSMLIFGAGALVALGVPVPPKPADVRKAKAAVEKLLDATRVGRAS